VPVVDPPEPGTPPRDGGEGNQLPGRADDQDDDRRKECEPRSSRLVPGPAREGEGPERQDGKHEVEDRFDGERPGGTDPGEDGSGIVVLDEEGVPQQDPGPRSERSALKVEADDGGSHHDARYQQDDPVHGQDPKGSVAQVGGQIRAGTRAEQRRGEGPIQQEPREREEERHAKRQVRHQAPEGPEGDRSALGAVPPHVVHDDAAGRQRTRPLDMGEPRAHRGRDPPISHRARISTEGHLGYTAGAGGDDA
jgi:hypothetical protein